MADIRREVNVGDLRYIAQVNSKHDFDGVLIAMIRYRLDSVTRHVVESHYWTPVGEWASFPLGGECQPVRIPALRWPDWARELVQHVHEPEAAKALTEAIDAAEEQRKSRR